MAETAQQLSHPSDEIKEDLLNCSKCKLSKPTSEFYQYPHRYRKTCKDCDFIRLGTFVNDRTAGFYKLTEDVRLSIISQFESGVLSLDAIARMHNIKPATLSRWRYVSKIRKDNGDPIIYGKIALKMVSPDIKTCKICNENKPLSMFHTLGATKHTSYCKPCVSEKAKRQRRERNPNRRGFDGLTPVMQLQIQMDHENGFTLAQLSTKYDIVYRKLRHWKRTNKFIRPEANP